MAPTESPLPDFSEVSTIDQDWVTKTTRKNTEERQKLEVELKTYSSNMIKESIRVRPLCYSPHTHLLNEG